MAKITPELEDPPTLVGQVLGKFRIIEQLGAGGMGVVYRAEDTSLGRSVALKIVPKAAGPDPSRTRRLQREARSLACLTHSSIATIYETGEIDGVGYIAMELIQGRSLQEHLESGPMRPGDAIPMFITIADALHHAHSKGVIHRDLKPSNVMVTPTGNIKLLDFGIAKLLEHRPDQQSPPTTHEGQLLGTPHYMSPEQARGDRIDRRSDVFSFGSLMYATLSGRPPFDEDTPYETVVAVYRRTPTHLSEVAPSLPADLCAIVHRCMRKEPELRYQLAETLRIELELLSIGTAVTASKPTRATRSARLPSPESSRSRRWAWLAIAAVAISVLAVTWLVWIRNRPGSSLDNERRVAAPIAFRERQLTATSPSHSPYTGRFSSDGSSVVYTSFDGSVWITSASSGSDRKLDTPKLYHELTVDFFPDDSRVLLNGLDEHGQGQAWVIPVQTGEPSVAYSGSRLAGIDVSPSGREFAYVGGKRVAIDSIPSAGDSQTVSATVSGLAAVRWSPSGEKLAYVVVDASTARTSGRGELWVTDRSGRMKRRLATADGLYFMGVSPPVWTSESTVAVAVRGDSVVAWEYQIEGTAEPAKLYEWASGNPQLLDAASGRILFRRETTMSSVAMADLDKEAGTLTTTALPATADRTIVHAWTSDGRIVLGEESPHGNRLIALDPRDNSRTLLAENVVIWPQFAATTDDGIYYWRKETASSFTLYYRANTGEHRPLLELPAEASPRVDCAAALPSYCLVSEFNNGGVLLREVTAKDGASSRVVARYDMTADLIWALSPDGRKIAYLSAIDRFTLHDISTGLSTSTTVSAVGNVQRLTWTRSSDLLVTAIWLPENPFGGILLLTPGSDARLLWSSDQAAASNAAVSRDGKMLAFSDQIIQLDLWTLDPIRE